MTLRFMTVPQNMNDSFKIDEITVGHNFFLFQFQSWFVNCFYIFLLIKKKQDKKKRNKKKTFVSISDRSIANSI